MSGTTFNNDGTIVQFYTVEATGTYDITAFGGQGGQGGTDGPTPGGTGGLGAEISGDFSLTKGKVLQPSSAATAATAVAASSSRLSTAPALSKLRW